MLLVINSSAPRGIPKSFAASHASDFLFVHVLVQTAVEMLPPLKEHGIADQLKPGGKFETRVIETILQVFRANIFCGLDLVLVEVEVHVGLDEEDIIDYDTRSAHVRSSRQQSSSHSTRNVGGDGILSCSPHFPSLGAL